MVIKAIILCGGKGTRLGLKNCPKPMVLLNGKTLLEMTIENLVKQGFTEIYLSVCHYHTKIMDYFGNGENFKCNIHYLYEEEPLGTAGVVYLNQELFSNDFLVIYGDLLLDIDWQKFLSIAKHNGGYGTLYVHPNDHPFDSDVVDVTETNEISEIYLKPHPKDKIHSLPNLSSAAIYYLNSKIFNIKKSGELDWTRDIFPDLIKTGKVYSYNGVEYVKDIGTPERLADALHDIKHDVPSRLNFQAQKPCVFLDRDGVINKETGAILSAKELYLLPNVAKAIKYLNLKKIPIFCVTNQAAIAKGQLKIKTLNEIHKKIAQLLAAENGSFINEFIFCPHYPETGWVGEIPELKIECDCRKPRPGMLNILINKHNIDIHKSYMIGDRASDIHAAKNAGCKAILVRRNQIEEFDICEDQEANCRNLHEAVLLIGKKIDYYSYTT
jgi:mannose-1-phosphate guanylyltransferase / phosphomannomutase